MTGGTTPRPDLVWYAGYGSNLDPDRFARYLGGGRPPGTTRDNPGARDRSAAREIRAHRLAGSVGFAWESPTWCGGIAFYDPTGAGETAVTAYLVTAGQFADVVEQEMWRPPTADRDLSELVNTGRHSLGPGRYETLYAAGTLAGYPVVTCTAPDIAALGFRAPTAAYLETMARGLRKVHGWNAETVADYLNGKHGLGAEWDRDRLLALGA